MDLARAQAHMQREKIDGWLVHDFRGSNTVLARLLGGKRWTTRRVELFIPASGQPVLLAHAIDFTQFDHLPGGLVRRDKYLTWREHREWLERTVGSHRRVAMEYAPGGGLPVVAVIDAGTVELVRSLGSEVLSSADLIQTCVAAWSAEARRGHADASVKVARVKDEAFALIRERHRARRAVSEREVVDHILAGFSAAGLQTQDAPIVAVNAHSGDPHFEVSGTDSSPIRPGDWVLIDLWARQPGDEHIFSDITWVGYCGTDVPAKHRRVYETVRAARDASLKLAQDAWKNGQTVEGWQLDDAARDVIVAAGFESGVRHRTGHSLSPGPAVHGLGMNLDNLETHDTRRMLPGIGFTIEPGIYGPDFGVRLEINVFVDEKNGPVVTSCVQDEIVVIA